MIRSTFSSIGLQTQQSHTGSRVVVETNVQRPRATFVFMAQKDIEEILERYVEPEETTIRLFRRFDISQRGAFNIYDIRRVLYSLGLRPRREELDAMLEQLTPVRKDLISYPEFRKMRISHKGTPLYQTCLNVICEFIKFNLSDLHRGRLTSESIIKGFRMEDIKEEDPTCKAYISYIMRSDSDGDGQVSFRNLFDMMTERVPQVWLDWVYQQVQAGTPSGAIVEVLVANGVKDEVAETIVFRTQVRNAPISSRCFADTDVSHSYRVMI